MKEKSNTNFLMSVFVLALPMLTGVLSSQISGMGGGQAMPYPNKPPLVPPGQVFPIVWTILYVLMGISFYLVVNAQADKKNKRVAKTIFYIQLFFNFIWPIVFFRFVQCKLAFIIICLLLFFIILNIIAFKRIHKIAGYLLIPYLIWVAFALYLNLGFCILN
ncbi:TspO/MBR family protein [[Clostridium] polysaccharolyticum]|uniref:TspO and MBR related proteins n=1 Tax=[Clostridium] polysaccharolyticum TaxID=29364 RepID=A0A1I0CSC9_9FIRM|nr:TspO/MBR family protein [[Clostridium] polysaccharolyticum]SET22253.1 TspO and MBR related proteins [[Clostridium] polysaccharolyticum]